MKVTRFNRVFLRKKKVMKLNRLNVRTLLLELTRECNLECKHCFRGNSQNVYMDLDIIDYIFNNVCRINEFLLTGGEPFLAKEQLKRITDNIMKDRTNISKLIIVTNGTIMSFDIVGMLLQIKKRTDLEIRLSNDIFHSMEIEDKGLKEIREKNIDLLKEYFNVTIPYDKVYIIDKIGRAEDLTEQDLIDINKDSNTKYILGTNRVLEEYRNKYPLPRIIDDDVVDGSLNIDVYGNITPTYYSFESEDKNKLSNIKNYKTLKLAINNIDEILK